MNLHKKLTGEVPMTYEFTAAAAMWVGAGVAAAGTAYSVYSGQKQSKQAKAAAQKQEYATAVATQKEEAAIKKQEALIAKKKAETDKVGNERKERLAHNELLTGSETGVNGQGSLLAQA